MKHRISFRKLGRKPAHRRSLYRNMTTALFKYERITTSLPKAKEIRRVAEKMITRARVDSVHNRRMIARDLLEAGVIAKLFTEIAPRFQDRPGGYTRILKLGPRYGDSTEMAILELVERKRVPKKRKTEAKKEAGEESK